MAEIRNYTMNFASGITLAAPALAFAATSDYRRVLWPANDYVRKVSCGG